jgi:hypothetical protein
VPSRHHRLLYERRALLSTVTIGLLHIICSSPHWALVLIARVVRTEGDEEASRWLSLIHFLPFIGSALNWIPAGILNEHLHQFDRVGDSGTQRHKNGIQSNNKHPDYARKTLITGDGAVQLRKSSQARRTEYASIPLIFEEIIEVEESESSV